jgi:hypothetical protein
MDMNVLECQLEWIAVQVGNENNIAAVTTHQRRRTSHMHACDHEKAGSASKKNVLIEAL